MWVTTAISILAIFLAHLSQFKSKGRFFELSFILLTIVASIQYGYGTDYFTYYDLWEEQYRELDIKDFLESFFEPKGWVEPGWMLLNAILGFNNGFFVLIAIISIVENFIYYRFIKEYVPAKWRWLSVFLYVGMDNLYLINFSMLRQGLVVSLFVAEIMLMNKKKLLPAVVLMVFALTIHMSAVICIPFISLYFLQLKNTRTIAVMLLFLTIIIFIFKGIIIGVLNMMTSIEELSKYSNYGQKTLGGVGFGYILHHIPNVVILYALLSEKIKTKDQKIFAFLTFCDVLITPLQFYGATLAGRLGVFFMVFRLVSVPIVYGNTKKHNDRVILLFFLVLSTLVMYIQFFQNYNRGYGDGYKTIFSAIL